MGFLALAVLVSLQTESVAPNVWIAPPKGRLERAGRDADSPQLFDVYPKFGSLIFRNRQLAFTDASVLTWITPPGGTAHSACTGKTLVGWSAGDPLLWDGTAVSAASGAAASLPVKAGEKPIFIVTSNDAGLLVSESDSGSLRITLTGSHPISANFGHWTLAEAHMATPTSGLLLLTGTGSAVVRVGRGKAEIVDIDPEGKLGIGLAADGRSYILRHGRDDQSSAEFTDVMELNEKGGLDRYCSVAGTCDLVDLDRGKSLLYVVRHTDTVAAYIRINFANQESVVLQERVLFVAPAFGGAGYIAAGNGVPADG